MTAMRTEVQVAGQAVVRLVQAALIPATPQGIRRAADALGIPVDAIRQANEQLRHRTFEPPHEEACRLRQVAIVETPPRRRRTSAKAHVNEGPHTCPEPGCDARYLDRRGLASHVLAHRWVTCEGCGLQVNARGIGAHRRHCTGTAS